MKSGYLVFPLLFCFNTAGADFSNSSATIHPLYLGANEPYIVDITGEWPTDCHPGEQKPVISEYTGDTALIEFETIVDHVTCNDVATPYRVLIDMSDVVGSVEGEFEFTDIVVRFGGAELEVQMPDICTSLCSRVPLPRDTKPEPGLYESAGLEKQGLLLARQNDRMGVYPLIYDESGSSEWLFGGGGIDEDVYFASLKELTGGQCLGCLPPDVPVEMNDVGKISMLMDQQGVIQVKINDGLFVEYRPLVFGYGELKVGGNPRTSVPDLSGRWAFSESDIGLNPNLSIPPTDVLPLVFDIVLESVTVNTPPIVLEPPMPPGDATYSIRSIEDEVKARMKCTNFAYDSAQRADDVKITCIIVDPNFEGEIGLGNQLFRVEFLSPERMRIIFAGLVVAVGTRSEAIAVRID